MAVDGKEMTLALVAYYMANIFVGVGSHRLWSHGSYKTTKFVEFILMVINSGTLQGPILALHPIIRSTTLMLILI